MTTGGGDPSSKDTADTLLRAIAAAPARPLEAVPERVAHFRILERLGQGGMGVVYRAEDETLRRTVALKLLPDASGNEEKRQRFLREARSAAAITHPNVAVVHQVGEADGRIYIAMELVLGENLRARLDRGRLDVETARELAGQIARGLSAAHDKGIVHRDLKPENVMITPAGLVKLLDFGLAKPGVDRGPSSGPTEVGLAKTETVVTSDERRLMGTPEYMSPEQALGEALDVRSDVFSFGIVLYEMLAGARPFGGTSTGAVLVAIARDATPPLRERAPDVDEATETIVARCLAKAPDERFANAGEIVTALGGQRTSGPAARSRTDVEPITRSGTVRAPPRGSVVAISLLAAAVGCGLAWSWMRSQAKTTAATAAAHEVSSSDAGAAHRGAAITDHPAPRANVAEAAAAYARALQAVRGASWALATDELERSTELDPSLAVAQLRATLYPMSATRQREHLAAAEQLRTALDERDQMFLRVAEARAEPRNGDDVLRRLRDLVRRFPDDAEAHDMLAESLVDAPDESRAESSRALALDPEDANALLDLAESYRWSDTDSTVDYASKCLEVSPSAASCLRVRAWVYLQRGQCSKFEADARTMTVVEPSGRHAYLYLARALASQDAPIEAVEEALRKRAAVTSDTTTKSEVLVENALALALLSGDLGAAEAAARRGISLAEGAQLESEHAPPVEVLLDVLEERGLPERALAEGETYERHAAAWTADAPFGAHVRIAFLRNETGRTDVPTLSATLGDLHDKVIAQGGRPFCWTSEEGLFVSGAEQAARVLAEVPDSGSRGWRTTEFFPLGLGRTLLQAGQPAAAVESLRVAANSCGVLNGQLRTAFYESTIWWMRAHVLLGQALEQTGDVPGACGAYAVVMDRWRNAKPRSITLEKAKERARVLGCPKH